MNFCFSFSYMKNISNDLATYNNLYLEYPSIIDISKNIWNLRHYNPKQHNITNNYDYWFYNLYSIDSFNNKNYYKLHNEQS